MPDTNTVRDIMEPGAGAAGRANVQYSPYRQFSRDEWARLRADTPMTLVERDLEALSGVIEELSLEEVRALDLHEATLPIACVEGWSRSATWRGVRVRDLLELAGAAPDRAVFVQSLQERRLYRSSLLPANAAADPDTLLALEVNGEPLHPDHGFPCRLIAPNRPGVLQTKWVNRLRVEP